LGDDSPDDTPGITQFVFDAHGQRKAVARQCHLGRLAGLADREADHRPPDEDVLRQRTPLVAAQRSIRWEQQVVADRLGVLGADLVAD
jgi:hypothetical protein